jgi:hypothetical protein
MLTTTELADFGGADVFCRIPSPKSDPEAALTRSLAPPIVHLPWIDG